jgi:hypothetical protein
MKRVRSRHRRRHHHRRHHKRRVKLSKRSSRRLFSRTAQYVHPRNIHRSPMRGGFRI